MLRDEAETLASDARRAGLQHVRFEKEKKRDKASWVLRASPNLRFPTPASLARYVKAPNAHLGTKAVETPGEQGQFFGLYESRFGRFTNIEEERA